MFLFHFRFSKLFQSALMVVLMLTLPLMFDGAKNAHADTYYALNSEMLLKALEESSTNQAHDTIKIADGVEIPSTDSYTEIGFSLTLEAGFTDNFLSRKNIMHVPEEPNIDEISDSDSPQQSTSDPFPSEGVEAVPLTGQIFTGEPGGTEKTIGVPGYAWRHGCGPTAVGMVLGYYDVIGFIDLFDGSAVTQTSSVDQGIASERTDLNPGHYRDYSQPIDGGLPSPAPDRSELPAGDEHTSDSVADFMETSFSSRSNYYGWSWSSDISPSFLDYVQLRNADYISDSNFYSKATGSLSWIVLTTEINNNRPMVFLVDTNSDGYTDHFVTVVGYRDSPQQQYGCLDTWAPVATVRWCDFNTMASGQLWGIWGGWSFSLSNPNKPNTQPWIPLW